jgi:hypothetical protein
MKSGFFHPETLEEFGCWNDIEAALGAERGLALVELGNALDLFAGAMAWLSTPDRRPHWLSRHETFWQVCRRWLCVDLEGYTWMYAGRIPMHAAE